MIESNNAVTSPFRDPVITTLRFALLWGACRDQTEGFSGYRCGRVADALLSPPMTFMHGMISPSGEQPLFERVQSIFVARRHRFGYSSNNRGDECSNLFTRLLR